MKALTVSLLLIFAFNVNLFAQSEIELKSSQSMLMTGKGPGQDGTFNPYKDQDCYAIVENIGENQFSARIQKNGDIIKEIPIIEGTLVKFVLLKGQELYIDTDTVGSSTVRISYERME